MKMANTGVFLQVRLDSRRLPEKALLALKGGNVVQHTMRALRAVPAAVYAILTDEKSAPVLREYAAGEGFVLFSGPAEDVLKRFCLAAEYFEVSRVIRATGDNPLVSPKLAEALLPIHEEEKGELSHFIGLPLGTGVEIVETDALLAAEKGSTDFYEHEHITTYLYRHRESFRVLELPCPGECYLPRARVTLDSEADYRLIARIFQELYRDAPIETGEIVVWFKKQKNRSLTTPSAS